MYCNVQEMFFFIKEKKSRKILHIKRYFEKQKKKEKKVRIIK